VTVSGLSGVTQVASGYLHSCALKQDKTVVCWGDNSYGALGNGTVTSQPTPAAVTGLTDVVQVIAGYYFSCALTSLGSATCWGYNGYGNLGDSTSTSRNTATAAVSFLSNARSLATGSQGATVCAALGTGQVQCWGRNDYGQLGNNTTTSSPIPVAVQNLTDASAIDVGDQTSCALRTTGAVVCWGNNTSGQFGNGTLLPSSLAVPAAGDRNDVAQVAVGTNHTCIRRLDGSIECFGADASGQLGNGERRVRTSPTQVNSYCHTGQTNCSGFCFDLQSDAQNCGGCGNTCAAGQACNSGVCGCGVGLTSCSGVCRNLAADVGHCGGCSGTGTVCSPGQVCNGGVCGTASSTDLQAAGSLTCELSSSGSIHCWGTGNGVTKNSPSLVNAPTDAQAIGVGNGFNCAIRDSGQTVCWGTGGAGQLGNGASTDSTQPVVVAGLPDAVQVSAGYLHACAVRSGGKVACWGDNSYGALGDGTIASAAAPVPVTGITDAVQVVTGYYFSCALRGSGEVVCWGYNGYGNLGDGTATSRPLASQSVFGLSNAVELAGNNTSICARRATGAVSCWGYNGYGQLGNNTGTTSYTPVGVSGLTDATHLTMSDQHACAIRSGGRVVCWGGNGSGQFGNGTLTNSLVPVPAMTGVSDAIKIAASSSDTCFERLDGSIWCTGFNSGGQLGNGDVRIRSTPVEVVGYCAASETNCSGTCHDKQTDTQNCGGCGNTCAVGQACNSGVCGCGVGLTSCSGFCRNLASDSNHCGGCSGSGTVCSGGQVCNNGVCAAPAVLGIDGYGSLTCAVRNSGAVACWGTGVGVNSNQPVQPPGASGRAAGLGRRHSRLRGAGLWQRGVLGVGRQRTAWQRHGDRLDGPGRGARDWHRHPGRCRLPPQLRAARLGASGVLGRQQLRRPGRRHHRDGHGARPGHRGHGRGAGRDRLLLQLRPPGLGRGGLLGLQRLRQPRRQHRDQPSAGQPAGALPLGRGSNLGTLHLRLRGPGHGRGVVLGLQRLRTAGQRRDVQQLGARGRPRDLRCGGRGGARPHHLRGALGRRGRLLGRQHVGPVWPGLEHLSHLGNGVLQRRDQRGRSGRRRVSHLRAARHERHRLLG
jgi:alpha-tubulin suppressor-like RCC1 family protein